MKENKPVDPYAKYNEQSNIIAKIILLVAGCKCRFIWA